MDVTKDGRLRRLVPVEPIGNGGKAGGGYPRSTVGAPDMCLTTAFLYVR